MTNFAERLNNAMTDAKIGNRKLATFINLENTQAAGISERTVGRWRRGELNKEGKKPYTPNERKHLLDMIKPLELAEKGQKGLAECNLLLQSAEFRDLNQEEQTKYFPNLKEALTNPVFNNQSTEKPAVACFAYDPGWVGREQLVAQLSTKVQGNYRILILVGITGIGKTALGEKLLLELPGAWTRRERINFDDELKLTDFASIAADLLTGWGEPITADNRKDTHQLLSRLVKRLREHHYLLLIDSLEHILKGNEQEGWSDFQDEWWPKFFQSLLAGEYCQSTVILTSQDLPAQIEQAAAGYQNVFFCQPLSGLEDTEQLALFEKVGLETDTESEGYSYLKRIGEAYEGHPLALRVIAGEIKTTPFNGNVLAYWNKYGDEIKEVENAIDQAKSSGLTASAADKYNLHKYTLKLRINVRSRLEKTFERLREVHHAYLLLCLASIYRCAVPESFWLSHLEDEGCDTEQQQQALEALRSRDLVEQEIDPNHQCLLRQHFQQSLTLSRQLQNQQLEGVSLKFLGNHYSSLKKHQKAIAIFQQYLNLAEEQPNEWAKMQALISMGLSYSAIEHYDKAIECYQKQLQIAHQIQDHRNIAEAFRNIGAVYRQQGDYDQAIQSHQQYLEVARQIEYARGEGTALNELAMDFHLRQDYHKTIDYSEQSLPILQSIEARQELEFAFMSLGNAYQALGQKNLALKYFKQAQQIAQAFGTNDSKVPDIIKLYEISSSVDTLLEQINTYKQDNHTV